MALQLPAVPSPTTEHSASRPSATTRDEPLPDPASRTAPWLGLLRLGLLRLGLLRLGLPWLGRRTSHSAAGWQSGTSRPWRASADSASSQRPAAAAATAEGSAATRQAETGPARTEARIPPVTAPDRPPRLELA